MNYSKLILPILLLLLIFNGCKKEEEAPRLVGQPGNPRFNLQFTNKENVDLDLHVEDPNGEEIYYDNTTSNSGGQLDVDCFCTACPNGPNENIFWEIGKAPKGTYKVWVKYYKTCTNSNNTASDFTLRIAQNEKIIATYHGTLTPSSTKSSVWTHKQDQ